MDEFGTRKRPEKDELVHWCHGAPGNWYNFFIIKIFSHSKTIIDFGFLIWYRLNILISYLM